MKQQSDTLNAWKKCNMNPKTLSHLLQISVFFFSTLLERTLALHIKSREDKTAHLRNLIGKIADRKC